MEDFWVPAGIFAVVVAILAIACGLEAHYAHAFAVHCQQLGGHVKTVYGYKTSTDYCVTDHGVVDIR